jgi:hypothetical protein
MRKAELSELKDFTEDQYNEVAKVGIKDLRYFHEMLPKLIEQFSPSDKDKFSIEVEEAGTSDMNFLCPTLGLGINLVVLVRESIGRNHYFAGYELYGMRYDMGDYWNPPEEWDEPLSIHRNALEASKALIVAHLKGEIGRYCNGVAIDSIPKEPVEEIWVETDDDRIHEELSGGGE